MFFSYLLHPMVLLCKSTSIQTVGSTILTRIHIRKEGIHAEFVGNLLGHGTVVAVSSSGKVDIVVVCQYKWDKKQTNNFDQRKYELRY